MILINDRLDRPGWSEEGAVIMSNPLIFLITGVSSGLGKVGTGRAASAFSALAPGRTHPVVIDVTDFDAIPGVVTKAEREVGPVDVLVNNAGYGHEGILEESPLEDMQRQFDANVFGAVAMIKAVLPGMRARRSGRIVNVTSMGGFITMPGIAYYCGSKFASKESPRRWERK